MRIRTQNVQNPADRSVSPANKNNDILNFPKHLKAGLEIRFDKHEYVRRIIKLTKSSWIRTYLPWGRLSQDYRLGEDSDGRETSDKALHPVCPQI